MKSVLMIIFGTIVLFTTITQAERKDASSGMVHINFTDAPDCEGRPEFITEVRADLLGGFEKLPKVVLVASDAEYYAELKKSDSKIKIHSYQSFAGPHPDDKSKLICGHAKNLEKVRFSIFAPTLIDTTVSQKVGQSLWQFQMVADQQGFSVWNKKSLAFSEKDSLEKNLMRFGGNYRVYQISHDQYEVVVSKDTDDMIQYLSVKYDAVKSL